MAVLLTKHRMLVAERGAQVFLEGPEKNYANHVNRRDPLGLHGASSGGSSQDSPSVSSSMVMLSVALAVIDKRGYN